MKVCIISFHLTIFVCMSFSQQTNIFNVSNSPESSEDSQVCFNPNNEAYVIWRDNSSQLKYRFCNDTLWSEIIEVYSTDSTLISDIAVTSFQDTCYLFWIEKEDSFKILYCKVKNEYIHKIKKIYSSTFEIINLKSISNSGNIFIGWLEDIGELYIHVLNFQSLDYENLGFTYFPNGFSFDFDELNRLWVFWLYGDYGLIYRVYSDNWSDSNNVYLEGIMQPLVEMNCKYNNYTNMFSFAFTGDIPTSEYDAGLFYAEGIDTVWSKIEKIEYETQHTTLPQINIKLDGQIFVLYQDGFNGWPTYPNSKIYLTKKKMNENWISYSNIFPDSAFLNYSIIDKKDNLFCSYQKAGDVYLANIEYLLSDMEFSYHTNISNFILEQNYPNPFNPSTTIEYSLHKKVFVELKVYNLLGQEVNTLVNEIQESGFKTVIWDGKNNFGEPSPSGVYIFRLIAGEFMQSIKVILLR